MERSGCLARHVKQMEVDEVLKFNEPVVDLTEQGVRHVATADDAFAAVFAAEYPQVVKLGYTMTRSDAAAQDAAQHAFAMLFERWTTIENPAGFVRTVALNRLRDDGRHASVRRKFLRSADSREATASDPDYLADALRKLPAQRRAMVVLRFYEQRTVAEIADILQVPSGSVKSGLSRAMQQLRGELT